MKGLLIVSVCFLAFCQVPLASSFSTGAFASAGGIGTFAGAGAGAFAGAAPFGGVQTGTFGDPGQGFVGVGTRSGFGGSGGGFVATSGNGDGFVVHTNNPGSVQVFEIGNGDDNPTGVNVYRIQGDDGVVLNSNGANGGNTRASGVDIRQQSSPTRDSTLVGATSNNNGNSGTGVVAVSNNGEGVIATSGNGAGGVATSGNGAGTVVTTHTGEGDVLPSDVANKGNTRTSGVDIPHQNTPTRSSTLAGATSNGNSGTGVVAVSNNGEGVIATSNDGTGVIATSSNGSRTGPTIVAARRA